MAQRVLVDANVIASRILTDWLFHLRRCTGGMFTVLWTHDIQAEAIRVMRRKHPQWPGTAIETRLKMLEDVVDELIVYPDADYVFTGSDEGDFHVHAAAVAGKANYILTDNKPGDITAVPDEEHYEILSSDDFFNLVADSNVQAFVAAAEAQFDYYSQPGRMSRPIHQALELAGCPRFAQRVKMTLGEIAQRR